VPRVGGFYARDLPRLPDLAALHQALGSVGPDAVFWHAPQMPVAHTPQLLRHGSTLFGPGRSPTMTDSAVSASHTREVLTAVLHDGFLVASSMTVLDATHRLFLDGVDNLGQASKLASYDPAFAADTDHGLQLSDDFVNRAAIADCVAVPVCGVGFPNYGHFLFDGLPAALLLTQLFSDLPIRLVGQKLGPWQRDILAAAGLLGRYLEITQPSRFRCMLASTLLAMHVSYPTAFIRPLFDLLRFGAGVPVSGGPRKVFLSRGGHDQRRRLRNRGAVEAAMAMMGFAVIQPDQLSFAEQIAALSDARLVVGESGAAMANLGFCRPGTKVLEIQPERFVEGWARGTCFQLGHRWHLYLAEVRSPPLTGADGAPLDPAQHFEYEIDPLDLMQAVSVVDVA
jgi:hypothetical protein